MISYETGESSKRSNTEDRTSKDENKDFQRKDSKNYHRRERSRPDLEKLKAKDEYDRKLRKERSKSSENLRQEDEAKEGREMERKHSVRSHREDRVLERKDSRDSRTSRESRETRENKRKDSTRHIRRVSELPPNEDSEGNAFLVEFVRNMQLKHHNSEPDLRSLAEENKAKKQPSQDGRTSKQKKVHPAIALIKSAISTRLAAMAKDHDEKKRVRETAHRLRRHTISEAATLLHYEPRCDFNTPSPTSSPAGTPSHTPVLASAQATTPTHRTTPNHAPKHEHKQHEQQLNELNERREQTERPIQHHEQFIQHTQHEQQEQEQYGQQEQNEQRDENENENENENQDDSDREYSPDMVIEKSYTPDLMRYADVDLTPQFGIVGVN